MRAKYRQRGVAGLVFLAVFVIVLVGVLTTAFGNRSVQNEFDAKTYPVLAAAKEALIAYAASHPTARGRLPCADTDNDGAENCAGPVADQLGRLPWKTLGLPIPRDGAAECLWYAVSGNFRELPISIPINSDANGHFGIVDDAAATVPLSNILAGATAESLAIAIIFAPGSSLGTNDREAPSSPPPVGPCGGNNNPANYLDVAVNSVNNALLAPAAGVPLAAATFVAGRPSPTFNDRLVYITPSDLFPKLERRVAREIAKTLQSYFTAQGAYPYASDFTGPDCTAGLTHGLLPRKVSADCTAPADWLPPWVLDDEWYKVTYYAVDSLCAASPTCSTGTLTALHTPAPNNNKQALVIMAGRKLPSQTRPCGSVTDCLEGAWNTGGTGTYESSPRAAAFNDVLVIVAP